MREHLHSKHAFTLIELLVVVAILTLLVMLLMPFLTRARDIAQRTICLKNMKTVGVATQMFATTHRGRAPGSCAKYNSPGYGPSELATYGFYRGLNVEILGQQNYWVVNNGGYIQASGTAPVKGMVTCPSVKFWGDPYPRTWLPNGDVCGGPATTDQPWGIYGIQVNPPMCTPIPDEGPGDWFYYGLGTLLEQFPRPAYQFMILESEVATDSIGPISPCGPLVLNAGGTAYGYPLPGWIACGGWFPFRHVLPPDAAMYQQEATANFLYVDGHVEYMTANEHINYPDRFSFQD